jgi:hypothetical protein
MSKKWRSIILTAILHHFFIEPFGEPGVVHPSAWVCVSGVGIGTQIASGAERIVFAGVARMGA